MSPCDCFGVDGSARSLLKKRRIRCPRSEYNILLSSSSAFSVSMHVLRGLVLLLSLLVYPSQVARRTDRDHALRDWDTARRDAATSASNGMAVPQTGTSFNTQCSFHSSAQIVFP